MGNGGKWIVGGALGALLAAGSMATAAGYDPKSAVPLSSSMTTMCRLGSAPLSQGSTPTAIAGVTIVSPQQAKCLIDKYPDSLLVVAAMDDFTQLPNAYPVAVLGYSKTDDAFAKRIATDFTPLTGGTTARPILIYCHHASCQYSANGAEHLTAMGYTRVYWLRDGTKGWKDAGYGFAEQSRLPLTNPHVAMFSWGREFTFGCFGEARDAACAMMSDLFERAYAYPDAKPEEKAIILPQLLNALAVRGGHLRTGGTSSSKQPVDLKTSLAVLEKARGIMTTAYANGANPAAVYDNMKVPRELALTYFAVGRPADAQRTLAAARTAGDRAFAGLTAARADKTKLETTRQAMIGSEALEREVAEEAGAKALKLYKAGKPAEAAPYKAIALPAYGRATTWIERNGKEGIGHFMDVSPDLRMARLKNQQADLVLASGDNPAAVRAYRTAGSFVCGKVSSKTRGEFEARKPISDSGQYLYIRNCQDAVMGEMKASGEWERMVDNIVARETARQNAMIKLMYGIDLSKPARK